MTPLNFVCRRRSLRRPAAENNARRSDIVRRQFVSPKFAPPFSHIIEMPMKSGFLRCRTAAALRIVVARMTRSQTRVQAKRCFPSRPPCGENNCVPKTLSGSPTGPLLAQNARISGQPIRKSRRRHRSPRPFPHAPRALHGPRLALWDENAARSRLNRRCVFSAAR